MWGWQMIVLTRQKAVTGDAEWYIPCLMSNLVITSRAGQMKDISKVSSAHH